MLFGNGWCINYQGPFRIPEDFGNKLRAVLKTDINSLTMQLIGEYSGNPVIPGYCLTLTYKIACQGTHSDAAHTNKIDII